MPVAKNGPTSRNPVVNPQTYSYALRKTNTTSQPIRANTTP